MYKVRSTKLCAATIEYSMGRHLRILKIEDAVFLASEQTYQENEDRI